MKILVCGDSYATLDNVHKHWATLWAVQKGHNTVHQGYPGESHVNIVTKLLQNDVTQYDFVIYHVTDYLRAQVDLKTSNFDNILSKVLGIYSDANFTTPKGLKMLEGHNIKAGIEYDAINISPNNLDSTMEQDNFCRQKSKEFYQSINLYWLLRANYNSVLLLAETLKHRNIPLVMVLEPELSLVVDKSFYPEGSNIFTTEDSDNHEIYYHGNSSNHLSKKTHINLAERFEEFINLNKILKQ